MLFPGIMGLAFAWGIVHVIIRASEVGAAQWWPSETRKVPSPMYDWVLVVWGQRASEAEV